MTFLAYLDEFGHIGPYVSRGDRRYKSSPVFGFAGYVLPADQVRGFGTWFFQRKCELLDFEIRRSGRHPALWEKKGASLYTVTNVTKYRQLRLFTNRLFNKIARLGGFVLYVGVEKTEPQHTARLEGPVRSASFLRQSSESTSSAWMTAGRRTTFC